MVRYTQEHKDATRRRILERAGQRFKSDGVDGSGVATLMSDAGLTNGAFYAHFESKDALVATVVGEQLATQRDSIAALTGPKAVESLVRQYLSAEHRDNPGVGCPSAALLDEIARSSEPVRDAYTTGIVGVAQAVIALLSRSRSAKARTTVLAAIAGMAGTLQMARAVTDRRLSDALLEHGVANALAALGVEKP
jgi:TetR/AcrR family transcriptional repressor of nem operon